LKEGRDADAVRRLGKHVYNAYEMFRKEIEASGASHSGGVRAKRNDKTEAAGGEDAR
jgi:hypothetical protein